MAFAVYLAICVASTPISECNRNTALQWIAVPERQVGLAQCASFGMQWAASSEAVPEDARVKVYCRPAEAYGVFG